ncbi:HdeD family acid-resistance protein [Actinomyces viscosus]|uniref:Acid-resistance membrane protein n=1 Tax=Actinomyces viscosus TaxID=1656 RepID=A0A3S4WIE1_ACTVI|nr:DUF308 domain-containing protein [Actinomyces viscosus]TFH53003.1 HdeD family acid-resistance protein [Actinomyces viscosus]VEI14675.1 acid-resistance membrane protein [Actinomyces viscosus]
MLKDFANRSSTALLTLGALGVLWGLLIALWPGMTALTFAVIWGVYALIDGVSSLVQAARSPEGRGWHILSGLLGVVAGAVVVVHPGMGVATLAWVLGVWLVARGVIELVAAAAPERALDKVLVGVSGLLWIIAGVVVMANPAEAALALTWFVGLLAVSWGVMLVVTGVRVRSAAKKVEAP